jgi:hypothetical protein
MFLIVFLTHKILCAIYHIHFATFVLIKSIKSHTIILKLSEQFAVTIKQTQNFHHGQYLL